MIVVVKKNGVACIGSDGCVLSGGTRKLGPDSISSYEKLIRVGKSYVGAESDAALPLVLKSYFSSKKKLPTFSNVDEIFDELLEIQKVLKEKYYLQPQADETDSFESLGFQMLIANPCGIFGVYSSRSVQEYKRFYAIGEGANYALGALQVLYDQIDSAKEIVEKAISVAADFDIAVGKPVNTYSIRLQ